MDMTYTSSATPIRAFTDLIAWQKGHALVLQIYTITKTFPASENFGLVSQLRRAAVSVTSNIAEGYRRQSWKEKAQFFSTSLGSLTEIQNQLLIGRDVGYIEERAYREIAAAAVEASKVIFGLLVKTRERGA